MNIAITYVELANSCVVLDDKESVTDRLARRTSDNGAACSDTVKYEIIFQALITLTF